MMFGPSEKTLLSQFIFSFWLGKFCGWKAPFGSKVYKRKVGKVEAKSWKSVLSVVREKIKSSCIDCSDFVRRFGFLEWLKEGRRNFKVSLSSFYIFYSTFRAFHFWL